MQEEIDRAAQTIESEIDQVLQQSLEISQMHQDGRYGSDFVQSWLKQVLKTMIERIESRESMIERRLSRLAEYYEKTSKNFMPGDYRADWMAQSARDMKNVILDTKKDKGLT